MCYDCELMKDVLFFIYLQSAVKQTSLLEKISNTRTYQFFINYFNRGLTQAAIVLMLLVVYNIQISHHHLRWSTRLKLHRRVTLSIIKRKKNNFFVIVR